MCSVFCWHLTEGGEKKCCRESKKVKKLCSCWRVLFRARVRDGEEKKKGGRGKGGCVLYCKHFTGKKLLLGEERK